MRNFYVTGTVGALTKMGEFKLVTNKTPKSDEEDTDHIKRAEQEQALDEALKNTFPASDPISMEQPVPPSRSRIDETRGLMCAPHWDLFDLSDRQQVRRY